MARKSKKISEPVAEATVQVEETVTASIENVTAPLVTEEPIETVTIAAAEPEPIKNHIIAKAVVPCRRLPNLDAKYIVGTMKIGTAYTIQKEVRNKIYGNFYLLNNGTYVTQNGPYTFF